jgi:hypothetical protein
MTQAALRIGVAVLLVGAVWLYTVHGAAILLDLRNMSGIFCF